MGNQDRSTFVHGHGNSAGHDIQPDINTDFKKNQMEWLLICFNFFQKVVGLTPSNLAAFVLLKFETSKALMIVSYSFWALSAFNWPFK